MKKILVPCDFYEPSRQAFRFAVDLARKNGAEVFALKVTELPVVYEPGLGMPAYGFDEGLLKELEEDAIRKLKSLKSSLSLEYDVQLLTQVGPVVPTILNTIKDKKIDAVVMGTHGSRRWIDSIVGSNTEKVVRNSTVPVFVLRKAVPADSIKQIIVPTELPLNQDRVFEQIKDLQRFFDATLHFLYVNTPGNFHTDLELRTAMDKFVAQYKLGNFTMNIFNEVTEEKGIMNFMEAKKADMIAMATHGRKGLAHLFGHSVTEEVLGMVEYPLWTCTLDNK